MEKCLKKKKFFAGRPKFKSLLSDNLHLQQIMIHEAEHKKQCLEV